MTVVARHARSLIIAVVVLLLSAGAVLGAKALPTASTNGLATAAEASGKTVPVRAGLADAEGDEDADEPDADAPDAEEPDADEADADEPEAEDQDTDENRGSLVSAAAQLETPEGFTNHGAWVSCVAHMAKLPVEEGAEPLTLEDITPEACAAADEARQAAKDAAKAERAAAKAAREAERAAAKAARDAAKAARRGGH